MTQQKSPGLKAAVSVVWSFCAQRWIRSRIYARFGLQPPAGVLGLGPLTVAMPARLSCFVRKANVNALTSF